MFPVDVRSRVLRANYASDKPNGNFYYFANFGQRLLSSANKLLFFINTERIFDLDIYKFITAEFNVCRATKLL